ncbi:chromate transporter [bacterium]|nr:MAG: chromate transporter [bacterium]
MSTLFLFWTILKASLLSTGGTGNAPIVHSDLVTTGLATERQFASALAIGQLSPGPTGFWIVAFGYMLGGAAGAVAATVAVFFPPLLVNAVAALYRHANEHPGVEGFVWGLGVTVAGVSAAVMMILLRGEGLRPSAVVIAFVALLLGLHGRLPVFWIILAGAVAGLLLH